ncbi:MAG: aspartate 1-decarboxylase [Candidatus Marinimicrobia bacterium]|nr:aspartate 1-decarboxylase [Candidatus Neomarinimicrobiota bacterium]|tara:strand:+ start:3421 stop:3807 length:387 start_codon:yes stop_codon:yes gene_type:complete
MEKFLQRYFLKCKIHRATVTQANLNYVGSITIDEDLLDAAGMIEHEKVHVLDITNGNRLETYIIKGQRGTGEICINGAAAHLIKENHLIIIVAYCVIDESEIKNHNPIVVHVDEKNKIKDKLSKSSKQ